MGIDLCLCLCLCLCFCLCLCERATGMCDCFDGFTGDACQRRACPMKCSGHGRCETMSELAQVCHRHMASHGTT